MELHLLKRQEINPRPTALKYIFRKNIHRSINIIFEDAISVFLLVLYRRAGGLLPPNLKTILMKRRRVTSAPMNQI